MAEKAKKKVVKKSAPKSSKAKSTAKGSKAEKPTWKPTEKAKKTATQKRWIAMLLWALAIGGEVFTILWTLRQDPINMVYVYVAIGVIGLLAIIGSLLWKRANDADPATRSEPVKFFFQNQLGAFIAIIAFLPLILFILANKNMEKNDKTIATIAAAAVMATAVLFGIDWDPSSQEDYQTESERIQLLHPDGKDEVTWTTFGNYYHLCEDASAVNLDSSDDTIFTGTVGDAHADGKKGITLEIDEEIEQCGWEIPEGVDIDAMIEEIRAERE